MRAILFLVPLGLLSLCGCRTQGVNPEPALASPAAQGEADSATEGAALPPGEEQKAIDAIRRGEYSVAHDILGRLLFAEHLAEAHERLASGEPEDALLSTEKALRLLPRDTQARLLDARSRLALAVMHLQARNPLSSLARGFAYCERETDGQPVVAGGDLSAGDHLRLRFARGEARCRVEETRP